MVLTKPRLCINTLGMAHEFLEEEITKYVTRIWLKCCPNIRHIHNISANMFIGSIYFETYYKINNLFESNTNFSSTIIQHLCGMFHLL